MSTQMYYSISNSNQRPSSATAYSDSLGFAGPHRRSPPHQGFGPGGINMYNQQQIQTALYQQQQIEFAQQQAQLEMHLQLEHMRLQNLALQEQIMIGQVQAHQAHAQSQAEQQLHNAYYSVNKPNSARMTFTQGQGGMLAERALARRQQAEADALYAQWHPNIEEEDDVLRQLAHAHQYQVGPERASNLTPPAVVVSKPDEAFPLLALEDAGFTKAASQSKPSNEPVSESLGPFSSDRKSVSQSSSDKPASGNSPVASIKKKFSDVVKSSAANSPPTSSVALAARLNPFSSVFVPGSTGGSDPEVVNVSTGTQSSPPPKVVSFNEPKSEVDPAPGVYRAPRSKSPTSAKPNIAAAPTTTTAQPLTGASPIRQPRGPAAEAELTNQNFATRIRKRAIKALGTRPSNCSSPVSATSPANYQYYQQQQMLEALMMQQHHQHALAVAGYLESDNGFHPAMVPSSGIAHLMANARAREERFGY